MQRLTPFLRKENIPYIHQFLQAEIIKVRRILITLIPTFE